MLVNVSNNVVRRKTRLWRPFVRLHGKPDSMDGGHVERFFPFHREWNGKWYQEKEVKPIFVVEGNTIVVVTVYTRFFGKTEERG